MTQTAELKAKRFPTDAEKTAMLASAEKMIYSQCLGFVRSQPGARRGTPRDQSTVEDAVQACRLHLWEEAGRFDLDGVAKWTTYAHVGITIALRRFREEFFNSTLRGQCANLCDADGWGEIEAPTAPEPDDCDAEGVDPDELDTVERSLTGVRRAMFGHLLEALTPMQRELVEAVVFRGLSLPQVALQRGQKLDIVEKNFRGVFQRLQARGLLTDDQAAAFGVTIRKPTPQKQWAPGERDRYVDAVHTDRPSKEVAAEFGVPLGRVKATRRNVRATLASYSQPTPSDLSITSPPAE